MGNVELGCLLVYFHTHTQNTNIVPKKYTNVSILSVLQRMYGGEKRERERKQLKEKENKRE